MEKLDDKKQEQVSGGDFHIAAAKRLDNGSIECEIYCTDLCSDANDENIKESDIDILKLAGLSEAEAENAINKLYGKTSIYCSGRNDNLRLLKLNWNPPGRCQLHPNEWEWDHGKLYF